LTLPLQPCSHLFIFHFITALLLHVRLGTTMHYPVSISSMILLFETIVPPRNNPLFSRRIDLETMAIPSSRTERKRKVEAIYMA
jgi:hypothetical protein